MRYCEQRCQPATDVAWYVPYIELPTVSVIKPLPRLLTETFFGEASANV